MQTSREQGQMAAAAVPLLYVCDWPPSNLAGGPILMSRLLVEYPMDAMTVLTSTRFSRVSPHDGRLACDEITVQLSEGHGRFGLGHIRTALNWLRVPLITADVWRTIRRRQIVAVLTILHGQFYFAAALAARLRRVPYIVVVHDDYVSQMNIAARMLVRAILRNAAHVYCVSPGMQETMRSQFGVDSELQWPSTERPALNSVRRRGGELSILYAGSVTSAVEDSLKSLTDLITSGRLREYGIQDVKLHLYTAVKDEQKRAWGWDHPDIFIHPWVGQSELLQVLRNADILFLPFSFLAKERHTVEAAFPSKTADYLASGTPIVVFAPNYSSLVAYARREGFGEIVSEQDPELLARAIVRIAANPSHRQTLSKRSLAVFSKNHDIGQQRAGFLRTLNSIVSGRLGHKATTGI